MLSHTLEHVLTRTSLSHENTVNELKSSRFYLPIVEPIVSFEKRFVFNRTKIGFHASTLVGLILILNLVCVFFLFFVGLPLLTGSCSQFIILKWCNETTYIHVQIAKKRKLKRHYNRVWRPTNFACHLLKVHYCNHGNWEWYDFSVKKEEKKPYPNEKKNSTVWTSITASTRFCARIFVVFVCFPLNIVIIDSFPIFET